MTTVTIAGLEPDQLLDVTATGTRGTTTGQAAITVVDTAFNRDFAPEDTIEINFDAGVSWTGEVTKKQSRSSGRLTISGQGDLLDFKHGQAFRVFYETESSEAVRQLVTEETEQLPETLIHTGDDPSNWESAAPVAEPYAGGRAGLYDFGTDMLFLGAREGRGAEIRTTYTSVSTEAIEDGFFEFNTRLITTDLASIWDLTIELRTPSGTSYRWEPDIKQGAATYELPAEDATAEDSGLNDGELRYRLTPSGTTAGPVGLFIDHASTIPFRTSPRSTAPTIDTIASSGRDITRRVDGAIGRAVEEFATEDNAGWTLNQSGFSYLPGEDLQTDSTLSIDRNSTPLVNVDAPRDFESVRNVVVVTGAQGIEVQRSNQASIDFYGRTRPESLSDPAIQTVDEAEERGDGFLEEEAWNDALVSYEIADLSYAQLNAAETVPVTDPDEGLDGEYEIDEIEVSTSGTVTVTVVASSARTQ